MAGFGGGQAGTPSGTIINPATGLPWTQAEVQAAGAAYTGVLDTVGNVISNYTPVGAAATGISQAVSGQPITGVAGATPLGMGVNLATQGPSAAVNNSLAGQLYSGATGGNLAQGIQQAANFAGNTLGIPGFGGPSGLPDISGIRTDSKSLFDQAMANYGRSLSPTEIRDTAPITAAPITGRDVSAAGPAAVQTYGAQGPVPTRMVAAPALGQASTVLEPDNLVANQAQFTPVARTTLDADPQREIREMQTGALGGLAELAQGKGPAAELERARLDQSLARLSDEAYAAANASRGAGRGAAKLQTALGLTNAGAQAAIAARANALENQIAARGQQVGALQGVRGQDIDFAGQAASLEQQANNLEAQIEAARQMGNAQEVNRLTSQQAGLRQQAREFNAQAVNQRTEFGATQQLRADEGNVGRELQAGLDFAGRADNAAQFGAGAMNTSSLDYGRRIDDAASRSADRDLAAQTATGAQSIQAQTATAQNQLGVDRARTDSSQGAFNATTQAQGTAGDTATGALNAQSQAINAQVGQQQAADAKKAADREFLLEAGTKVAAALSDERSKTNIKELPQDDLEDFGEAMAKKVKSWEYKPGEGPPGTHFGPMAQDLENTDLGRDLVSAGPDGKKRVNMDDFANLLLAATLRSRKRAA